MVDGRPGRGPLVPERRGLVSAEARRRRTATALRSRVSRGLGPGDLLGERGPRRHGVVLRNLLSIVHQLLRQH